MYGNVTPALGILTVSKTAEEKALFFYLIGNVIAVQ